MNQLVEALLRFLRTFKLWVTVAPWEQGIRVRLGKTVHILDAGVHLRIPLADVVTVQSTRLRFTQTDRQTITCKDGRTVSVAASIGYEIVDLAKLYRTVHHAEDTIRSMVRGALAEVISDQDDAALLTISSLNQDLKIACNLSEYGLLTAEVLITDLAFARTYRVIGDYAGAYQHGTALNTETIESKSA